VLTRGSARRVYLGVLVSGVFGCTRAPERTHAGDSVALVHDSVIAASDTTFQAQLAKYRRDERVIDSIMQVAQQDPILRSDSIYKAYRLALRPQGVSEEDVQRLNCLEMAIAIRYGLVVKDRVVGALRDTVFRDQGATRGVDLYWSRAPSRGRLDSARCPEEPISAPEALNGTRLDEEPPLPKLPRQRK
jgi:hypothetical protein